MEWTEHDLTNSSKKFHVRRFKGTHDVGKRVEGRMEFQNGDVYEGRFRDNKFQDTEAKYTFRDQEGNLNYFVGSFDRGVMKQGTITYAIGV